VPVSAFTPFVKRLISAPYAVGCEQFDCHV
jgi:hypothetical protein